MAATNAVLETYELLEAIILHLSPFDVARAMRVSKTWYSLIQRSSRIHDRRILAPIEKHEHRSRNRRHIDGRADTPVDSSQIPIYASSESTAGFRYNPNIPWPSGQARQSYEGHEYMGHYINFGPDIAEYDWRLNKVWDAFATFPPCQAVALRILKEEHYCVVYSRDGVTVKHLKEASDGMLETVGRFFGSERKMRAIVTGWVFETIEKEERDASCDSRRACSDVSAQSSSRARGQEQVVTLGSM